jgi:hypothetical protein
MSCTARRPDYHRATRNAYRTLIATGIDNLPVDVTAICKRCRNTMVLSFNEVRDLLCEEDFEPLDGPSRLAFTLRRTIEDQVHYLILWNDEEMSRNSGLYRFSMAHELAHIVMKHGDGADYVAELEANCFAQHLLCPRPVLDVLQPADYLEISYLCGVSRSAALAVRNSLRQENRYVDPDMWNKIFAAFNLDENRNVADYLSSVQRHLLTIRRRQ